MEGVSLRVLPLEGGKIEHKREREREREREGIFAWEITQGDRQQGLGFVNNVFFCKAHKSRRICETLFDVPKKEVPHRER